MSKPKKISVTAFIKRFSMEEACRTFLEEKRWAKGFKCPKCCGSRYCKLANGRFQCSDYHYQTSITAGTFFNRSHVSLVKWFLAIYFVTHDKRGISATQLAFSVGGYL